MHNDDRGGRALITGATGTIGARLAAALGEDLVVLSRDPERAAMKLRANRFSAWDGATSIEPGLFEGVDTVFHLAGEPVAEGRWSADKKQRILESRVRGTRAIVDAIGRAAVRPRVLVCASAVGIYGDRADELLTEQSPRGTGFLADVCAAWEAEALAAEQRFGVRTVTLRIGIVLARDGGALTRMLPLFRTGLGGRLGSGEQWMPWVHIDDVVGLFLHAARHPLSGPVNAVAPQIVTNDIFTRVLATVLSRPARLHAPRAAIRLALGELSEIVLASQRVAPVAALSSGYRFRHAGLSAALRDLLGAREVTPLQDQP